MPAPLRYRLLDPLRGLAALWVFTVHFPFFQSVENHAPGLLGFFERGHLGVPMFFVISGFCLLASARHSEECGESPGRFLYRRLRRIYPPFWCSVVVVMLLPYVIEAISYLKTGTYTVPELAFAAFDGFTWLRFLTLTQAFAPGFKDLQTKFTALNIVYWSLAIEVQFYLIMALARALPKYASRIWTWTTLAGLTAALFPSTYDLGLFLPYWPMFAFGLGLYLLLEGGYTPANVLGRYAKPAMLALGLLALGGLVATTIEHRFVYSYMLFALSFAALLWVASPLEGPVTKLLRNDRRIIAWPMQLAFGLGTISYSVYLLHNKLCFLTSQFVRQLLPVESLLFPVVAMGATVLVCAGFYWLCERPFLGSGKKAAVPGLSPAHTAVRGPHLVPATVREMLLISG